MSAYLPAFFALTAAALWGFNMHVQRAALDDTDALTGAFLSVGTSAGLCWLAAPFLLEATWWTTPSAAIFAVVGLVFPAFGQRLQIVAVEFVGATLTASLSALTPAVAVAIGLALFGEHLSWNGVLGLGFIVSGLVLATWSPRGIKRGWPLWAILFPISAAVLRGLSQPALKFGMQDLPSPYFALLVTSSVSTIVLAGMLWQHHVKGRTRHGPGMRLFVVIGAINGAGILSLNAALGLGVLTLVSPLAATVPLWTLLFGAFVFRRETLGIRHLAVAILVVVGGVLVLTR